MHVGRQTRGDNQIPPGRQGNSVVKVPSIKQVLPENRASVAVIRTHEPVNVTVGLPSVSPDKEARPCHSHRVEAHFVRVSGTVELILPQQGPAQDDVTIATIRM
jgi:hypothetical protein